MGLTTLPPSCTYCLEIWEPEPPTTLMASNWHVRGFFTFYEGLSVYKFTILTFCVLYFKLSYEQIRLDCTAVPPHYHTASATTDTFIILRNDNVCWRLTKSPRARVISYRVTTVYTLRSVICCSQDFSSAPETDDNCTATNSPDVLTVCVGSLAMKL